MPPFWGGETQALIYNPRTGKVIGVNALGVAPTGATPEYYRGKNMAYPPEYGPLSRGGYGYLWWLDERPYKGRTVKTYLAGGNGSQIAMAVPELDLVIGFWGGNYSGTTAFIPQDVYVPEWILPAVQDKKNLTGS